MGFVLWQTQNLQYIGAKKAGDRLSTAGGENQVTAARNVAMERIAGKGYQPKTCRCRKTSILKKEAD